MAKLSYLISVGNSNEGPVGMCARVTANSPEEALEILSERLEAAGRSVELRGGEEYIETYFNPDVITIDDIYEVEDVDY